MPCWELFEAQTADYRDEVLPPDVKARLSIEAGVELGWSKWVGDEGGSISIEHFGASARRADRARGVRLQPSTTSSRARRRCWSESRERGRDGQDVLLDHRARFSLDGELPAVVIEAIEVRKDGHAIARVEADDGRVLPVRFTFDEGRIASGRGSVKLAVAFDHRGVHLREAVFEALGGGTR